MFDFKNLFVGYNARERFRVLIVAEDEKEASEVAEGYRKDLNHKGYYQIHEMGQNDYMLHFDCDRVLHKSDCV